MAENREVKSDVFSMLMEDKEYALEVYNVINESSYEDSNLIEMTTLKKGISLSIRNDASIILDMNLNIYEHQSTFSPNMPLRSLIYMVDILKPMLVDQDIYGRRIIKIPTPKFVVFYNGREKRPSIQNLRLSEAFEHKTDFPELELQCTVYNINPGYNDEMLNKCKVLADYTIFIERIRINEQNGAEYPIRDAIDWCIANNILKEFLLARKPEVLKAMTIDMTFERREEIIRRDERKEGRLEVLLDLVRDGSIDIATAATKANMSVEKFETMLV